MAAIESTAQIEREAAATRDRIASTIDDLQARLSPKALVDSAFASLSAAGNQAVASVRTAAVGHPLAIAATGLAAGIALIARSRINHAAVEYGDSYAAYADYDDGYAASLAEDDVPAGRARASIDAIQHQAHVVVDDNPFGVIAAGLATGAVIGALIPVSPAEHALFGDLNARIAAAADAGIDALKGELDVSKLSFAGGTAGITERLVQSLLTVVAAAGTGFARRPVSAGSRG